MLQVVFTIIKCNSRLKSNGKLLQEDAIEATDMDLGKSYTFWGAAFAKKDLCIIPVDETDSFNLSLLSEGLTCHLSEQFPFDFSCF